jgi:hypothetical protein
MRQMGLAGFDPLFAGDDLVRLHGVLLGLDVFLDVFSDVSPTFLRRFLGRFRR